MIFQLTPRRDSSTHKNWNSNPVTKAIFAGIDESLKELKLESCRRKTVDETAMKVAFNEGIAEGIQSLKDGFEILAEDSE